MPSDNGDHIIIEKTEERLPNTNHTVPSGMDQENDIAGIEIEEIM